MPIDWLPLVEIVRSNERFLLSSHVKPDCDAVGSQLGLAAILRTLGKQVTILNADPVPKHLRFIDPGATVSVLGVDVPADRLPPCDVWVILDTCAWRQLGALAAPFRQSAARKLVIDHHLGGDDLGAELLKDTCAEATGRLVVEAAEALGVVLTGQMARPLFTALATDTGWFRFSSVSAETFATARKLLAAGADAASTYCSLYEQNTLARLLLRGRILASTAADPDGQLSWCRAMLADFEASGAEQSDTEDVVNQLLGVVGTEVAVLFVEVSKQRTKASLRSRSAVDVRRIAETFGGGGHAAAAGLTFEGPIGRAEPAVLGAIRKTMQLGS